MSPAPPRPRPWFVALCLGLVRLYYPRVAVAERAHIPVTGPALVVANHPNGLLDPLIVSLALGRTVAFLAKSTFWKSPLGRFANESFGAMPVYRAHEDDPKKNEATFARCRALLAGGGWLALFPEGKSHDGTQLAPLKTGAARIALGTEAEAGWSTGLAIVPVGILYEEKAVFRSRVSVRVGTPLRVADWRERYEADPRAAAEALTEAIAAELGEVVLQADDAALWRGLLGVAQWMSFDADRDDALRHGLALTLAARVRTLAVEDPERLQEVVRAVRQMFRVRARVARYDLRRARVPDLTEIAALVALAPPAVVGAVLGWVPYRLVRPVAERLAGGHHDLLGTIKILLGALVLTLTWLGWTVVAGVVAGPLAALGMFLLAPACAWAAVRFDELLVARYEELAALWLSQDARRTHMIEAHERAAARRVSEALGEAPTPSG